METLSKFLRQKPFKLTEFTNQIGQHVDIYEHPTEGDAHEVIAVINGVMKTTSFFDCEDFYEHSEYNPVLYKGQIICAYELEAIDIIDLLY